MDRASAPVEEEALAAAKKPEPPPHRKERAEFRALLLSNPNYFGNLKVSPFKPVLKIQGNTTYEEIGCVGYAPTLDRLEAVVLERCCEPLSAPTEVDLLARARSSVP